MMAMAGILVFCIVIAIMLYAGESEDTRKSKRH
jgi:hypothetical protein